MKDYEVTVRVRNNWMLRAMEAEGIETAAELSRRCDVPYATIILLLGLRLPFWRDNGWHPAAIKISEVLKCTPESLVPPQHLADILKKNKGTFEADVEEMAMLVDHRPEYDPLALIESKERKAAISEAMLKRLSKRERTVVELLFGLDGGGERTLEQCGEAIGTSGTRAAQIRNRAIIKLKFGTSALAGTQKSNCESRAAGQLLAQFRP